MQTVPFNPPTRVFEVLLKQAGHPVEGRRSEAAHAWCEAQRSSPVSEPDQGWRRWLVDAGSSLGLRLRPADLDSKELFAATALGATAVVRSAELDASEDGPWLVLRGTSGRRIEVLGSGAAETASHLDERQLPTRLGISRDARVPCVLLTPEQLLSPEAGQPHKTGPVRRLLKLLRPELADVWVVLVFALFVGLLTLATPIAVEALVNTVAFGRLLQPVFVLSLILLTALTFAAALRAAQIFVVEILQRRLFVRLASDLALRLPRVRETSLEGTHPPELVNRFLEVVTVQKVTAQLMLEGVQLVLSALVGMALLAVYHPWLLGFDLFLLVLFAAIVFLLGRGAIATSIQESKYKYQLTAWLEEVARCRNSFRLPGGAHLAAEQADRLMTHYLEARQRHFRVLWRQILFSLAVQAVASTVLLGLGGWLVISGQLTLGQLVAAELIVAVIVSAFTKLGKHFESFYDLAAAIDKLSVLLDLPLEPTRGAIAAPDQEGARLRLTQVSCKASISPAQLRAVNLFVEPGERVAITDVGAGSASLLADLLFGLREPDEGIVQLDDLRIGELRRDRLRSQVLLLRSPDVFEATIAQNLSFDQPQFSRGDLTAALRRVGLEAAVSALPEGLDSRLAADGSPLSRVQLVLLMLARAVLHKPRLLVIDGMLDALPDGRLAPALTALFEALPRTTIVLITGRRELQRHCHRTALLESQVAVEAA